MHRQSSRVAKWLNGVCNPFLSESFFLWIRLHMICPTVETMDIRWQDLPQLNHFTGVNIEGITSERIPHALLRKNQILLEKCARTGELWSLQPQGAAQKQRKAERRCQILKDMLSADLCCPHQRLSCVQDMLMVWDWESMCLQERERQLMPPPAAPATGIQRNRSDSNVSCRLVQDGVLWPHPSDPLVASV